MVNVGLSCGVIKASLFGTCCLAGGNGNWGVSEVGEDVVVEASGASGCLALSGRGCLVLRLNRTTQSSESVSFSLGATANLRVSVSDRKRSNDGAMITELTSDAIFSDRCN